MGIEDFRFSVHKIVEFSLRIILRFLQNHPYVSTVFLFLFLLYALFSYIVSFLLFWFPFFFFVAVLLHIFRTSETSDDQDQEQERDSKSLIKNAFIDTNLALTNRRRYRVEDEGWEGKDTESPAGKSASSKEKTGKEISPEIGKESRSSAAASAPESSIQAPINNYPFMRSEPSMSDFLSFGGLNSQTRKSNGDCELVGESSSEVEEEEEEAREDEDKAVKWTENDQKNLMDLGFSEMERNRRLESLIAKRSGKNMISDPEQDDLSTMDRIPQFEIAKVFTGKQCPFDIPSKFTEVEGLPIPGSAPSVLHPMRNPFGFRYDQQEEMPNLAVDGFRQEFAAANQKELSFCRHGSFSFGPSFPPQSHQDLHDAMTNPFFSTEKWEGLGNSRFRRSSPSEREDHEWLVDPLLFKGKQQKSQGNNVDFHLQDSSSDTSSSSTSEMLEVIFNGDGAEAPHKSLTNLPSNGEKMDCFSFTLNAAYHTPTYSIASDLQVEVSEISSPPMTLDGTCSPTDGESYTYDGDIEKEMTLGGEEIWDSSSDVHERIEKEIELRKANQENVSDHVNFWAAGERSEDAALQWNPFAAAITDSVDLPETSNMSDREMKDKDSAVGEVQSSELDSEEPGSPKRDEIFDQSIYDDDTELPKPGEDEDCTEESEDSVLQQISGEPIISGGMIMSNSSSSPGKFKQQSEISASETETAKVKSSSSDEDATSSSPTEIRRMEDFACNGDDDEKLTVKFADEFEFESEKAMSYEHNSELEEAAISEPQSWIKHGGPKDEPGPDDINGDHPSSPFTKPGEQSGDC